MPNAHARCLLALAFGPCERPCMPANDTRRDSDEGANSLSGLPSNLMHCAIHAETLAGLVGSYSGEWD